MMILDVSLWQLKEKIKLLIDYYHRYANLNTMQYKGF